MFALLAHPLFRDAAIGLVLLLMLAGAWGYYQWSRAEMAALHANLSLVQHQADTLLAAKTKLEADVAAIKQAQDAATGEMAHAREVAAQSSRAIRANTARLAARAHSDPRALELQVNREQADALQTLEDASR